MKAIEQNPYRILGLLAGATAREQIKQVNRLKLHVQAGQKPEKDFSFPVLGNLHRTVDSIEAASSQLNLDADKMSAALFWFYKGNETDELAFNALKEGNVEEAKYLWEELIIETTDDGKEYWMELTGSNYSAFHNWFVLEFFANITDASFWANIMFLESDFADDFKKLITDVTYHATKKDLQLLFLNQFLHEIETNRLIPVNQFIKILNHHTFSAKEDFLKNVVSKKVENIEKKIKDTKEKRKVDQSNDASAGNELYATTSEELNMLRDIVGTGNIKYSSMADKVADEILQCGIDSFNKRQSNISNEEFDDIIAVVNQAKIIAVGNFVQNRIEENLKTITEAKLYLLCYYCGQEIADSESAYKQEIYKETARYSTFNGRRVEFRQAEVSVPRCKQCKEIHGSSKAWWYWLFPIAGVILLILTTDWHWFSCLLVGGIIGLIISTIIGSFNDSIKAKNANIKKEEDIRNFEPVKKLLNDGWTFSKPQA